ncbi:hypothetical protein SPRG_15276 [Saprolegnia parasitica CBS 223.65]|uniref:RNA-dependent RNA polymerase n=1 Tax=Saprolegnia parasitica (strain CBS 223.65) TaxID=695850 RepID=A0A067BMS7_SAPPC|nr:hypothetical protein SPRG_15276 [Saprolegnia parasitica CBS 223.65]KDO19528.1 hypothetical protein SPRG_15276 [Saprolegnia parasitica CBS 223.65]|eukprot:XP_012209755.1 hypothetical protein SPRG_15276 [Saprolegnia parasitica CBS 223.65]
MHLDGDRRLAELVQARSMADDAVARTADRASAFTNSTARQRAATSEVVAATVTNVPSEATAADVAAFCRQHANIQGFLSVSMAPYHRGRPGRSTVHVASQYEHARLLRLDGFRWQRQTVSVRAAHPIKWSLCADVVSEVFSCSCLHVLSTAQSAQPTYSVSDAVTLTCSATEATAFGVAFNTDGYRYRVCFKVTSVARCRVSINRCGHVVVRITLRVPPFCYVGAASMDRDRSWPIADALQPWQRADDPSPNGAFGACRCYHLVLVNGQLDHVINVVRGFGVADVARDNAAASVYATMTRGTDWAHGYASFFQSFTFPLRYALHVLLSQDVLLLSDAQDAECIAAVLAASNASAQHVLGFLQSPTRGSPDAPMALQSFLDYLDATPAHFTVDTPDDDNATAYGAEMALATVPEVRRVLVTPLRIVAEPPQVDVSNRILRQYAQHIDRFLRVSFVDENFGPLYSAKSRRLLDNRIAPLLHDGLVVGGENYVFLGYSNSQLRVHSCWFYRNPPTGSTLVPSAASIYFSQGDLHAIPSGSKRGARLGQAFSTTTSTVAVSPFRCSVRADVTRNGYVFSDGIGVISSTLADDIAMKLHLNYVPSAYQIRYGGWKGVVSVDAALPSATTDMELRDSMRKFASEHDAIEVCSVPQVLPAYLNRQLITLLSTLGVRDDAILSLADDMLRETAAPLDTLAKAIRFVKAYAPKAPIRRLLEAGISIHDQLVADWLHLLRRHLLYSVQFKARIRVPDGVVLMGVLDETNTLPEGCIFFQSSGMSRYAITPPALGTRCVVGRNPSLHPGDLRILTYYTDVPALHHLYDVLVFSSRGDRPVTDMMSGGDLDGDLYFCLWDHRLVPAQDVPPMPPPPTSWGIPPPSSAPGIQGIQDHFVRFLEHDNLGMIANMHLAVADASRDGAHDPKALELAHAHAVAVDFAKSGVAAPTPTLNLSAYPDFMERSGPKYESKTALGVLFRRARTIALRPQPTGGGVDWSVVVPGYEAHVSDARHWFVQYAHALFTLCQQYGIGTEVELISGYIQKLSRKVGRAERLDPADDAVERIRVAVRFVQEHYARVFWRGLEAKAPSDLVVLRKASAWYYVGNTYDEGTTPYRSFAWLALEPLCVLLDQR